MPPHRSVMVRVPATTANLGPGFDSLGMALSLWNRVRVNVGSPPEVLVHGNGAGYLRSDRSNLTYRAAQQLFAETGMPPFELRMESWHEVPLSRGLGSSACAIVAGLVAANALLDFPLPPPALLDVATAMEGHPDNVAAALVGGCCIATVGPSGARQRVQAAQVPLTRRLRCVLFVPEQRTTTGEARATLTRCIPREDAVFNIGRVALLVAGLATDRPELLATATEDRLHQLARTGAFPAMPHLIRSALGAGADGAFLSGSGPSIVALTDTSKHRAMTIGYEMADMAAKLGVAGEVMVLEPDHEGTVVLELDTSDIMGDPNP